MGQFPCQMTGRYLLTSARILSGPQGREITRALAFGFCAQWSEGRGGEGKGEHEEQGEAKTHGFQILRAHPKRIGAKRLTAFPLGNLCTRDEQREVNALTAEETNWLERLVKNRMVG